jgi:hypothetical protein
MGKKNPHAMALGKKGARLVPTKLMKQELSEQVAKLCWPSG